MTPTSQPAAPANPHEEDLLQAAGEIAGRLAEVWRLSGDPGRVLKLFDQLSPTLEAYGESRAEVAELREQLEEDPLHTILALGAGAARQNGHTVQAHGEDLMVFDPAAGRRVAHFPGALRQPGSDGSQPS